MSELWNKIMFHHHSHQPWVPSRGNDHWEKIKRIFPSCLGMGYCWWTKSCTTKDDDYPIIHRVLTIPGGAGFLPSTVPSISTNVAVNHWVVGLAKGRHSARTFTEPDGTKFPKPLPKGNQISGSCEVPAWKVVKKKRQFLMIKKKVVMMMMMIIMIIIIIIIIIIMTIMGDGADDIILFIEGVYGKRLVGECE